MNGNDEIRFWKMNGAGNDFIIINNTDGSINPGRYSHLARVLCERHLSIGADGMMFVEKPTEGGDYRMAFYNADGSRGEMCGNGARCICRYGYENGLAGDIQRVETTAGLVTGHRIDERIYKIKLNDPDVVKLDMEAEIPDGKIKCSYVELGKPGIPHAVVFYEDVKDILAGNEEKRLADVDESKVFELGRKLRYSPAFPKGANINFADTKAGGNMYIKTYERGVEDITYACGTGTASTAAVLALKGANADELSFDMKGGTLIIELEKDGDIVRDIYLTGPTNIVAKGVIYDEEL